MTAYEITQDLFDDTTGDTTPRRRHRRIGRVRGLLAAGLAAGALVLAVPGVSLAPGLTPAHSAPAGNDGSSAVRSSIMASTRRTGTVSLWSVALQRLPIF